MCEPVTIAGMALALIGGGVAAYGQVQQGKYADQVGKQQQALLEQQALREQDAAEIEADKIARAGAQAQGRQLVTLARNNADLGGDLAQDLLAETELVTQFERNMVLTNARNRAQALSFEGKLARTSGRQTRAASYIAATGTLLQSASAAAQTYSYGARPRTAPTSIATGAA